MTCSYCGTRMNEGEHRCRRCGRKPDDTLTGEFSLVHTNGALATQPVLQPETTETSQARLTAVPNLARAVQRSLFQERASNVIPIAPAAPRPRLSPDPNAKSAPRPVRRRSRVPEEQGSLDFLPAATAKPRTLGTAVEAMIYCEERVAAPAHRAFAAALDWSMVLIGYGIFLAVVQFAVGGFPLDRTNLMITGAVLPLFGIVYGLAWALAEMETPGMQWSRLRMTTFEGFRPERRERLIRLAGSCLSLCTVVGLLWSLADEEGLAWQDHISRTFPTPRRADSQVFHRR